MLPLRIAAPDGAPLRVLCLGAHCDDIEIGCGGTLMRLLAEQPQTEVRWIVLSSTAERAEEARSSAASFLAPAASQQLSIASFRESFFPYVASEIKDYFEEFRCDFSPDLILTHCGGDRHQDHRIVSELTWNTFRDHWILEYEIPKYDGDLGQPHVFFPLSEEVARRKAARLMEHFASQAKRSWFTPDTFLATMRIRGVECNAPGGYAEAFYSRKLVL